MAGILDALSHESAHGGGTVTFAVGNNRTGALKVKSFVWTPRLAGSFPPKLNAAGSWPANTDVRDLVIDLEGMIIGSSPSDYWSQRGTLMDSVVPPASRTRTIRHHGTLSFTPAGGSAITGLVNLTECECPLSADGGRWGPMRISWVMPAGYWSGGPI